jgi:hypothetical protein
MVDELGAEFTSDTPCQPAQARAARCKYQRELRGHVEIFSDNPHTAIGYVRDRAIARQRADPELNLCRPVTGATFALSPIRKHPTHPSLVDFVFRQSYRKSVGLRLSDRPTIDGFPYRKVYRRRRPARLDKSP